MTSAVMAGGSRVVRESLQALSDYLQRRGQDASALIGLAADRLQGYAEQVARPDYWQDFVSPEARSLRTAPSPAHNGQDRNESRQGEPEGQRAGRRQ